MTSRRVAYLVVALAMATVAWTNRADKAGKKPVLRHVVLFQYKEGTAPAKVKEISKAFAALPSKIDAIVDFEWGTDVSVEDHADGFTHCFLVTFSTQAGLNAYLPHEAHQGVVGVLKPHLDKVLVVDYWARK